RRHHGRRLGDRRLLHPPRHRHPRPRRARRADGRRDAGLGAGRVRQRPRLGAQEGHGHLHRPRRLPGDEAADVGEGAPGGRRGGRAACAGVGGVACDGGPPGRGGTAGGSVVRGASGAAWGVAVSDVSPPPGFEQTRTELGILGMCWGCTSPTSFEPLTCRNLDRWGYWGCWGPGVTLNPGRGGSASARVSLCVMSSTWSPTSPTWSPTSPTSLVRALGAEMWRSL